MTTKIPDRLDREIHSHKFGVIEFRTQGAGVFFASDKLKARIGELSREQLREANQAAWKLRRKAEREANRYSNVSVYGHDASDRASHAFHVAKNICDVTWAALQSN